MSKIILVGTISRKTYSFFSSNLWNTSFYGRSKIIYIIFNKTTGATYSIWIQFNKNTWIFSLPCTQQRNSTRQEGEFWCGMLVFSWIQKQLLGFLFFEQKETLIAMFVFWINIHSGVYLFYFLQVLALWKLSLGRFSRGHKDERLNKCVKYGQWKILISQCNRKALLFTTSLQVIIAMEYIGPY